MDGIDKYYRYVEDLISRKDFERKIREKISKSGFLISEDTAARLVAAELGRNEIRIRSIASLEDGESALIEGYVENMGNIREFTTNTGRSGKVLHIVISDDSGICRLALWNRDTSLKEKLKTGTKVRIINGKVKNSRYGLEISLGKWSSLWVEMEGEWLQIK